MDQETAKKAGLQEVILKYISGNYFVILHLLSIELILLMHAYRVAAATFVLCTERTWIRVMYACFSLPLLFFLITFNYIFRLSCPTYILMLHE